MSNDSGLIAVCKRDQGVWDSCASVYEREIVRGHPDILAYEAFEEDFLDRVLCFLAGRCHLPLHLVDVGCGSGRLHVRYGLKTMRGERLSQPDIARMRRARAGRVDLDYDPALGGEAGTGVLARIGGIDFSSEMIVLARGKLEDAGFGELLKSRAWFRAQSAFDLEAMDAQPLPVLVTVCNSIGVMQGPDGAQELFRSLRRAVEPAGGIAIISAYRREAVVSHALGNYESTMNVSGQPRWLAPRTYSGKRYTLVARRYKRAWDPDRSIVVDVFDGEGNRVRDGLVLTRVTREVEKAVQTGHIRTWTDYESHWYGYQTFEKWIDAHWGREASWHIAGSSLDALRAEPAQLAIYDPQRRLANLLARWNV